MYLSSLPKGGISLAYKTKENHVFNFCHDILKSIRKIVCIFVSYSSLQPKMQPEEMGNKFLEAHERIILNNTYPCEGK